MVSRSALYFSSPSRLLNTLSGTTSYDRLKSGLFYYVVITYTRKACRHVLARGVQASIHDAWLSLARVSIHFYSSIC